MILLLKPLFIETHRRSRLRAAAWCRPPVASRVPTIKCIHTWLVQSDRVKLAAKFARKVGRNQSTLGHNTGTHALVGRTINALFYRVFAIGVAIPPSPPSFFDSAEVLQKQAFLERPDFCGGAPRWSTVIMRICHWRSDRASGNRCPKACGDLKGIAIPGGDQGENQLLGAFETGRLTLYYSRLQPREVRRAVYRAFPAAMDRHHQV